MSPTLVYIHGQYGSPEEAEYFDGLAESGCGNIGIIANSIGAFYAMCALSSRGIAAAPDRLARADAHPLRGE